MEPKNKRYFLGLDCGTNSVGWAATDEKYKLLRNRGKYLWGVRLFDAADTAADRRTFRSGRRRHERAKTRLKLLRRLFRDELTQNSINAYMKVSSTRKIKIFSTVPKILSLTTQITMIRNSMTNTPPFGTCVRQ